jgi:hypothetical protein
MLLEYRLEAVLGAGGFGMTYLCKDTNLDKRVAIKEYFPADLALRLQDGGVVAANTTADTSYQWGLERFLQEARTLAKFSHPHIVRVNRYFEANATGYMVMDYEHGESLNQLLQREPLPGEPRIRQIIVPLLDGLQAVHETGFLHRDIKPANIFIRSNGSPVLLDFGAARQAVSGSTKSLTSILTPGYAPLEQYSDQGAQGPWSDIYAMGGVLYRTFTSENPPDAVSRLRNDAVPAKLAQLKGRVSESALRAVDWALTLDEKQRPRSVEIWKHAMEGKVSVPSATRAAAPMPDAVTRVATAPLPEPPTRRSATVRPIAVAPEPASAWRWVALGALVVLVLFGGRAWYNQRAARETARLEAARAETARLAALQRAAEGSVDERAAHLRDKERSLSEREEAVKRLADRDDALRRLEEERQKNAAPVAGASASDTKKPVAPVVAATPAAPAAQPLPAPAAPPRLEDYSGDALDQKLQQDFRHMDANNDGFLTPDEVRGRGPIENDFSRLDANGDGRLSLQEFMSLKLFKPPLRK